MRLLPLLLLAAWPAAADPFEVVDREGFGSPMTALRLELPPGWTAQGRVAWQKPCSSNELYEILFTATSPDGQSGMRTLPGHLVAWNDVLVQGVDPYLAQMAVAQAEAGRNELRTAWRGSNCHVGQVAGTQQLLDVLVLAKRPQGTRVLKLEPNAPVRDSYARNLVQQSGMRVSFDAVIATLQQPSGLVERVWLSWYQFADDPATTPQYAGVPGFTFQQTYVDPIGLAWAPAGREADIEAAAAAFLTVRPDTAWLQEVRKVQDEINRQRQQANKDRQDAADRRHRDFIDMIRGPEDPAQGQ